LLVAHQAAEEIPYDFQQAVPLREQLLTMGSLLVERRDGVEQLAAVPDNSYAEFLCPADSGPSLGSSRRLATQPALIGADLL
jgi:hypothetical protein